MSCNKCAATADAVAPTIGAGGIEVAWSGHRDHPQNCKQRGAFLRRDGGCTACESGDATLAAIELTAAEKAAIEEAGSPGKLLRSGGFHPLNNDGVRRLHANYVSISCGQDREVVLDPKHPTAATDLGGKVYLNPYPLGENGKILDQMVVAQSYIDHELLHELYTPRQALDAIVAVARKSDTPPALRGTDWEGLVNRGQALPPAGSAVVKDMLNILEDGRIERLCEQREPFMWQRMLAGQAIQPKDDHARNGGMARLKPYQQVMWATQIEVQPNYTLTPDIRRGMTGEALETVKALRPLIKKGGRGTAYDAVEASIDIVEEMARRGLLVDGLEAKPPAGMPVHEASSGAAANGDVAPEEKPGDRPPDRDGTGSEDSDSDEAGSGDGDAGSEDSDSDEAGSGDGNAGSEDSDGDEAGSGGGDAGSEDSDSDEAGSGDGDAGSEDSDSDEAGSGDGDAGSEDSDSDEAGSEDSEGDEQADDIEQEGGLASHSDAGADNAGGDEKVDSDEAGGGGDDQERCSACGAFKTPDNPCENCEEGKTSSDSSPSAPGGDKTMQAGEELEETEEMRRRQEELRRQAEQALEKARVGAVDGFRRAVKKVVKDAERRTGEKVAAGLTTVTMPFIDENGKSTTLTVRTVKPGVPGSARRHLEADRAVIGQGAAAMAQAIKKMRMEVERNSYLQKRGVLDRRRMTAAIKGSDRVRMQTAPKRDLSMAVSVSIDRSGSMYRSARELGTIAGILAKGMEKAQAPYEMRSYTDDQFHHKTFAQRKIEDRDLLTMYTAGGDNDDPVAITLGGLALDTRQEATKVQFVVTDGEPLGGRMMGLYGDDVPPEIDRLRCMSGVPEVHHAVKNNQEKGHIVQAIFYAKPSGKSREEVAPMFDYMYGPGNWTYIAELKDLPRVVTKTLTAQMAKAAK